MYLYLFAFDELYFSPILHLQKPGYITNLNNSGLFWIEFNNLISFLKYSSINLFTSGSFNKSCSLSILTETLTIVNWSIGLPNGGSKIPDVSSENWPMIKTLF